ncbi:zinc-binding dehydrogenase [Streptosporangium saharense]|uniref:zinc-binding dehydrogenase n=1 Tax=Streptosporangium saharense TaxID=1706840 RepID=UPI00343F8593
MRAVQVVRFGGPETLVTGQLPEPVAGAGQVVVEVAVADVLFLDTQLRGGWAEYFDVRPPYVPGSGVGGRVVAVGEGVDPGWAGRDVVTTVVGGAYAERAVAVAEGLVPVPDGLDMREAVSLLQTGPAALRLADEARIAPGDRVLVTAAAGGLGGLLVQLAHAAGARVVAAARGERKLAFARELGADVTVDYSEPGWTEQVRRATGSDGPDVVFDGVGGEIGLASFGVTARGGRFFGYGAPSGGLTEVDREEARRREVDAHGIEQVQFSPEEIAKLAGRALAEAAAGRIRPVIGRTFPLERAADAHLALESREVLGKVLLLV